MSEIERRYQMTEYLEQRFQLANNRLRRRWFNEAKLCALWGLWFLPWLRELTPDDDISFDTWESHRKKAMTYKQIRQLTGSNGPSQRLIQYKYVVKIRHGLYRIGPRGLRCSYEYALRALMYRQDEKPADLRLQDYAAYWEVQTLQDAFEDGDV